MIQFMDAEYVSPNGKIEQNMEDGTVRLVAASKTFGQKFYGEQESFLFRAEKRFQMEKYFVLEYACQGLRRQLSFRKPFLFAVTAAGGEIPLVYYDDIIMDNRCHSVIIKAAAGEYSGVRLAFGIDRRTKAHFTIYRMGTCAESELPFCCSSGMGEEAREFRTIDISQHMNRELPDYGDEARIDGGRFFDREQVTLYGIPFSVKTDGKNVIAPPPPPAENEETILNFGVPAKRRLCRPVSRDGLTEIGLNQKATELFFLMAMDGKRHQRWGFASDGTILGEYCGDVTMPILIDDTEGFMVEIIYTNGNRDTALPLNVSSGRHGVSGDVSVYAVPCDGSEVERVVFHNRKLDTDCCIAAITINQTGERLFPEMLIPEQAETISRAVGREKEIELRAGRLCVKNGAFSMSLDISEGLRLLDMTNEFTPEMQISPGAMLKLRDGAGNVAERFALAGAEASGNQAELCYRYGSLMLTVCLELAGEHGVTWRVNAKNEGDSPARTGILFPCISGLQYADNGDGWYFFPKYQNVDSNETVFIYEESAPSFPMQFFDVYSPAQQGGLSLTTQEQELVTRKYALQKDEEGIDFYVEYPEMYGEILPGKSFCGSPTVLTAHTGDWRKSFEIYKSWLDSWYEPYRCQDKQWYRECFWLLAEITDFFETKEFTKLPVWYDKEKKKFRFNQILEEQKEITGCYPDILHLWSWAYKEDGDAFWLQWGNFGSSDYDEYGGLENFRDALQAVRKEKGVNVSLYLHPTLLSGRYPQSAKYFPRLKVVNDIGENISIAGDSYRMCHANDEWREYATGMYPRIYKELGIPLLYVDEFSLRIENRCYGEGHGHSIPSSLLKTDRDFITGLKEVMPEEVVLYGEYAAVDVNARYIDCNISYYIIDSVVDMIETAWRGGDGDDRLGRVFTDMYRFAFPKIVQLVLPMAMRNLSWHPQKFLFFNGEAIYDSFWDCEESAGLAFTVKAYHLKKKYADCFSSDEPEAMIDTASPAICANRFPGKGRTVYTLYNRAYTTYRGVVLRVPHAEGNSYFDAWNNEPVYYEVKDGCADLYLTVDAQQVGCVVVGSGLADQK